MDNKILNFLRRRANTEVFDIAGKQIKQVLDNAGLDFDFCEDTQIFDEAGNELESAVWTYTTQ